MNNQTGHRVDAFTADDIKAIKDTLPPRLTPLHGALKIHELQVDSLGKVSAKHLPSDPVYFPVKTDASWNPRPRNVARLTLTPPTEYPDEIQEASEE